MQIGTAMKITILIENADPAPIRELADAIWAAQKNDVAMSPEIREVLKSMSTHLHGEAARLEKSR
jgi:hypothetical protein